MTDTATIRRQTKPLPPRLDSWFLLSARGSTIGREVRGGVVTFFTMAYIVVLNPLIIGTAKDVNGSFVGGGKDVGQAIALVTAATALCAGLLAHEIAWRTPALSAALRISVFFAVERAAWQLLGVKYTLGRGADLRTPFAFVVVSAGWVA